MYLPVSSVLRAKLFTLLWLCIHHPFTTLTLISRVLRAHTRTVTATKAATAARIMNYVYSCLIWLRNDYAVPKSNDSTRIPVHIFTDSMYTQTILCDTFILKTLLLDWRFEKHNVRPGWWLWHWIPSHIENTSVDKLPICGNVIIKADKLARLALEPEDPLHKDMTVVRKEILVQSAQLIHQLLTNNPHICTTGGQSSWETLAWYKRQVCGKAWYLSWFCLSW
jgi:hypothetical protein